MQDKNKEEKEKEEEKKKEKEEEKEEEKEYALYFDGASKGNPGLGGSGFVIYNLSENCEIYSQSRFIGKRVTNNYAEYFGLYLGLSKAYAMNIRNLHIYGDSLLIIKQMTGQFTVKAPTIIDLYTASKETCKYFDKISFTHIPRDKNKRADELANEGIKNRNQLIQPLMPA